MTSPTLSCAGVRRRLLEGDAAERRALTPHLTQCPDCARLAEAVDDVDLELHGALASVVDRPLFPPTPPRRFSMSTPAIVLAIAASLALALTPVLPDLGVRTGAEVDFAVLDGTQRIPAQALSAADWADRRDQLYQLWEVASAEAPVERRFALAVELGRTAALASEPVPPFFEGRENVFYRTARALDDAEGGRLVAAIGDPALAAAVSGRDPASPVAVGFMEEVDAVSGIPWNALTEDDWADRAERLLEGYRTHRDQLSQKQLMVALAQMGRSAENANQGVPPFYGPVPGHEGGPAVNRAWYAAAMLEMAQPELVEKVSDLDVRASILQVVRMVEQGRLPAGSYRDVFVE